MSVLHPISNPPSPWLSAEVEYLSEIPDAKLEVYEDRTREILASNDSPDVGFSWSVNPYRGCFHSCAYAEAARALFESTVRRLGMNADRSDERGETFRRPGRGRQLPLL